MLCCAARWAARCWPWPARIWAAASEVSMGCVGYASPNPISHRHLVAHPAQLVAVCIVEPGPLRGVVWLMDSDVVRAACVVPVIVRARALGQGDTVSHRSEEHTSELQSLM